jgi:hypothetical protein
MAADSHPDSTINITPEKSVFGNFDLLFPKTPFYVHYVLRAIQRHYFRIAD